MPFFFTISSFFLFKKMKKNRDEEKKVLLFYLKRMGILYLFWFILFLPISIDLRYTRYVPVRGKADAILIFINSLLWTSSFQGSWYLNACIICAVLIFAISRKCGEKVVWLFSGLCFLCTVILSAYYGLVAPYIGDWYKGDIMTLYSPYNTFAAGMIYFVMGKYIAENEKENLIFWKNRRILLGISILMVLCESVFIHTHDYMQAPDCFFTLLPATYFIVINALYCEKRICISEKIMMFLRESSIIMYITHFRVLNVWSKIDSEGIVLFSDSFQKYIATILLCLAISGCIIWLEKFKVFRILKYSH